MAKKPNKYFVRIVKMVFKTTKIDEFLINFEQVKGEIRSQKGNLLEMYQDESDTNFYLELLGKRRRFRVLS